VNVGFLCLFMQVYETYLHVSIKFAIIFHLFLTLLDYQLITYELISCSLLTIIN